MKPCASTRPTGCSDPSSGSPRFRGMVALPQSGGSVGTDSGSPRRPPTERWGSVLAQPQGNATKLPFGVEDHRVGAVRCRSAARADVGSGTLLRGRRPRETPGPRPCRFGRPAPIPKSDVPLEDSPDVRRTPPCFLTQQLCRLRADVSNKRCCSRSAEGIN